MPSGSIRSDVLKVHNITPGEDRSLVWTVVDDDGEPITSMVGWTVKFYLLDHLGDAHGIADLDADALLEKSATVNVPTATVAIAAADLGQFLGDDDRNRKMAYELWRTNAGNSYRLAFGDFIVGL